MLVPSLAPNPPVKRRRPIGACWWAGADRVGFWSLNLLQVFDLWVRNVIEFKGVRDDQWRAAGKRTILHSQLQQLLGRSEDCHFHGWCFPISPPNVDIGYPKLFMVDKAGVSETRPQATVNNFVAATAVVGFGWPGGFISGYSLIGFPAPAGQVC